MKPLLRSFPALVGPRNLPPSGSPFPGFLLCGLDHLEYSGALRGTTAPGKPPMKAPGSPAPPHLVGQGLPVFLLFTRFKRWPCLEHVCVCALVGGVLKCRLRSSCCGAAGGGGMGSILGLGFNPPPSTVGKGSGVATAVP